jgi:hypothetical protein
VLFSSTDYHASLNIMMICRFLSLCAWFLKSWKESTLRLATSSTLSCPLLHAVLQDAEIDAELEDDDDEEEDDDENTGADFLLLC